MPTTRKKVIKTIYKDEEDSDEGGDFSDSGSDAQISEDVSSEDEEPEQSSSDEFNETFTTKKVKSKPAPRRKPQFPKNFAKNLASQANKYSDVQAINDHQNISKFDDEEYVTPAPISVKDLTEADKQLPSFLNLSESDSSDDEASPKRKVDKKELPSTSTASQENEVEMETETHAEYKDIWSANLQNSEEIAQKAFKELEQHKNKIDAAKSSLESYESCVKPQKEFDVSDLLAQGEVSPTPVKRKEKSRKIRKGDSESEMEDWEEVQEQKEIPHQGIELVVEIPDAIRRKTKKLDIEMMMKRRINRTKKEQQVYIHKVHVLCWIAHGNFVSKILNSRKIMAAALSLVPSKDCYPKQRVDIKYVEQIVTWFKDKLTLKQDKHEHKFKPKAPPLNEILLEQMKNKVVTSKRYQVFIFVSMLRALGLQCRIMFNFVTAPLRPPSSELCSLSAKPKDERKDVKVKESQNKNKQKYRKNTEQKSIPQVDGICDNYDSSSESVDSFDTERFVSFVSDTENLDDFDTNTEINDIFGTDTESVHYFDTDTESVDNLDTDSSDNTIELIPKVLDNSCDSDFYYLLQLDGNDDTNTLKTRPRRKAVKKKDIIDNNEDVSPPKRARSPTPKPTEINEKSIKEPSSESSKRANAAKKKETTVNNEDLSLPTRTRKSPTPKPVEVNEKSIKEPSKEPSKRASNRNKKEKIETENVEISIDSVEKMPSKRSRKSVSPNPKKKNLELEENREVKENEDGTDKKEKASIEEKVPNKRASNRNKTVKIETENVEITIDSAEKVPSKRSRKSMSPNPKKKDLELEKNSETKENEDGTGNKDKASIEEKVPNKRARKSPLPSAVKNAESVKRNTGRRKADKTDIIDTEANIGSLKSDTDPGEIKPSPRKTRSSASRDSKTELPKITVTNENNVSSIYFGTEKPKEECKRLSLSRNRSQTANPKGKEKDKSTKAKARTKSAPNSKEEKSKFFNNTDKSQVNKSSKTSDTNEQKNIRTHSKNESKDKTPEKSKYFNVKEEIKSPKYSKSEEIIEDGARVSHRDLLKGKTKPRNDVSADLVKLIKGRVREAKSETRKKIVIEKLKDESDDSDYLPEVTPKRRRSSEDFKPSKISPNTSKTSQKSAKTKPSTSRKIDRRVLSTDVEELPKNKMDVWCEVFIEEIEEWIAVDVIKAQVHCAQEIYNRATHPVCYVVGWDNSNFLKDLTRRYVPHWNTITRKNRAEPSWWQEAIRPWMGPNTRRDKQEDDNLDRMQLDAPLPTSIGEYKNHPLYALKRHLLKFEAIYPPDAATLGFVRNEAVYARECVYICRSRDTWLKEAKVVKLGEQPYKIVKARPKWDKLSNKLITDKPLELFGPWQCQDYEPPTAENGIVPRNAYGNVELFKECMLPKGTVHIKLPGLNRVAKKLNIDCAPAMTGFDFNGGWSHPVYDGYVVCTEFGEIITEAWVKDQEEQERKEREKIESRVYGNWKRLIKGLLIRERLKDKYGFDNPTTSQDKKKGKGPKLVVKKRT